MSTTITDPVEINTMSMNTAATSIAAFVNGRKLVLSGTIQLDPNIKFPSQNKKKEFRKLLERVIKHPTMKNVSIFLRKYAKYTETETVKIDYSEKEKKIQEYRKAYIEARKKAEEAQARYKEEKGDFFKNLTLGW